MDSSHQQELDPSAVAGAVAATYAAGAHAVQPRLCCPVEYDPRYLEVLPEEILARDYGCGDPSRWVREGETVLDLGSGAGKICFIASQVVGPQGHVIGVDMTPDMLALARKWREEVGRRIGWQNVEFRRGRIEDLALDLDRLDDWLTEHPVRSVADYQALEAEIERLRRVRPLVTDDSVDVVVSNCVLNLVAPSLKERLFGEIFRVLKRGGRAVISDIVCDREVPLEMQRDPELWAGCISGALEERAFLRAFEEAGFHGIQVLSRGADPWRVVEGIAFRSLTVAAYKGKHGPCVHEGQSVIYRGPFRKVWDDDDHLYERGERVPVCAKTYALLGREPYQGLFTCLDREGLGDGDPAPSPGSGEGCCC